MELDTGSAHAIQEVNISTGSVATRLRRGGITSHHSVANLLLSVPAKEIWNRSIFHEVMNLGG